MKSKVTYRGFIKKSVEEKEVMVLEYNLKPKICPTCKTTLPYSKRHRIYCSIKCSNSILNVGRKKKKDLSSIGWEDIQKAHDDGLLWSVIPKRYGFSMTVLRRAEKNGLIRKIKRKHEWTDREKKSHSEKRIKYLSKNPDSHHWRRDEKFKSVPCEMFKEKLKESKINFIDEFKPLSNRSFSVDIAFPDKKIGIEINGNQHYNSDGSLKEYYQNRKDIIEKDGWKIFDIHYSKVYDNDFISEFIEKIKEGYSLSDVDYTFYVRKRKEISSKYGTRAKYFEVKKRDIDSKNKLLIDLVLNSGIDFFKFGWSSKVSALLGIKSQKSNKWMKRYMPDFYEEKCYKKKNRFGKSRDRKYGNKDTYSNARRNNGKEIMQKRINMLLSIGIDFRTNSCRNEIMEIFNFSKNGAWKIINFARMKLGIKNPETN